MVSTTEHIYIGALIFFTIFKNALAINCYQCLGSDSDHPFQCNEMLDDFDMEPEPCTSIYDAKYCIKHVGRFEGITLKCYQCTSASSIYCSDGLIHSGALIPKSCDHVFEARYCIKSMGLVGGIGAKRYCSSLDLGNYCNYVKQPGDILEYRSCVYTCKGDGCNSGHLMKPSIIKIFFINAVSIFFVSFFILNIRSC